jgi:hypothetical protein
MSQIMLGFVVRQCAIALGHAPTAAELMEWANAQGTPGRRYCLFGRPITVEEARVILRHPGRPVTVRDPGPLSLFALGTSLFAPVRAAPAAPCSDGRQPAKRGLRAS